MKKLRKVFLRIPIPVEYRDFFDMFEKYEVIELCHYRNNLMSSIQKVKFKAHKMQSVMILKKFCGFQYIEIIGASESKNECILFSIHELSPEVKEFFEQTEVFIDPPVILDSNCFLISFILDVKDIDRIYSSKAAKLYKDEIEILSIGPVHLRGENFFLILTDRQKEIMYYAVQQGYYETPRRVKTGTIANHFDISRSGIHNHLRKVERTIFNSIFRQRSEYND